MKYVKAEIQFWWDESDNSIHVTAVSPTDTPLHTTFPANNQSERWHRSMFTWLAEKLAAEGKPSPQLKDKFQTVVNTMPPKR